MTLRAGASAGAAREADAAAGADPATVMRPVSALDLMADVDFRDRIYAPANIRERVMLCGTKATSVLGIANQSSQSVLSLLR